MSIGIVGAGISGLHLALRLQQFGLDTTLYTAKEPDGLRSGPPLNFVTRFDSTRRREQALGITRWSSSAYDNAWMHMSVEGPGGFGFRGRLPQPASSVDFRMYLAALLEAYAKRGGDVTVRSVADGPELAGLAGRHDLLVVAAGRGRSPTPSGATRPARRTAPHRVTWRAGSSTESCPPTRRG
ncbi:hypothetical protein O1L44_04490 [Streptomyces noursei]|nr:hypothetical protein [Streptomyces noursei]